MAWHAADSLSLRQFLDVALQEAPPDHSTVSRTRRRIDVETHQAVFTWVLQRLVDAGLLQGKTVGIDATTLEANAALRSIVRRDTGEGHEAFLRGLAAASGIPTPTRAELARLDRKRPKKGSNDDWTHPQDPDAKITKMKDGRTHLAHKAEHVVDLETGAVVGVTVQGANVGDTTATNVLAFGLTDDAKAVLKLMQGDSTGNGIFMDVTGLGTSALRLACLYKTDIGIQTTRRVITELDAKGLVEPHQSQNGQSHGVKLTHLGWILNPETGKADKVG